VSLHPNLLGPSHDHLLSLPLEDGGLPVPDGPGLGVALDDDQLSPYVIVE